MNGWSALERFLDTDPRDCGCGETGEILHVYVDLAAADPDRARQRFPQVAAHLAACPPCEEDFAGILAAVRADLDAGLAD